MFGRKRKKYSEWSDEQLIEQFLFSEDSLCFGILYERYGHLVLGSCYQYLKNQQDAEDICMYIFEKLPEKLRKHEIQYFKSWLFMVTRNECLMFLRKSVRKNVDITDFQPMEEDDPEEAIRMEELLDDVVNLLDELKEDQRNCMRLFYFEKLSYQQISVQLKMEIKAVKSAIQNGKRNIRIRLIEKNETNG